ncbi:metal ABC transporter solute-binding protein, Zn/Mn family [Nodosilinea nodulosa]|uniref:metal ABC transporter solute-binding protein, Zn/Mn family n=1 Tax=Nodosilinea nodulosa TaxID=416001 RepID=UPI000474A63A|nr:zinc ABC transporter substrate-binding protein [Nodosilinea nodulosa]
MNDSKMGLRQKGELVHWLSGVIVSAIAVSLGSCATNAPSTSSDSQTQPSSAAATGELQVITTILPITEFTKAVAGDRAEVTQLLPNNVGPHDYQARPEDAQRLANADVLVENGLDLEEFLDDLVTNAGSTDLKIIDSSEGIATISNEDVEGDDHAHAEGEEHAEEGDHHHGEFNPHIWLDPERAVQQVENIRDGLIAADPEGEAEYKANAAAYIAKLQQLDQEFSQQLQPFAGKTFVTYHDFAPYFAQRYNLNAEFLVGIPEENASPDDVQRVINAAKSSDLKTLLTEPQAAGNPFSALAKDLNVQVSDFDPMETAGEDGLQPDYYFTVMRQNLTNLTTALGGQSTQSFLPALRPSVAVVPQTVGVGF